MPLDTEEFQPDKPLLYQLVGLSNFATAAALGDSAHIELEEPAENLARGLQMIDFDLLNDSLAQISTACEGIDY